MRILGIMFCSMFLLMFIFGKIKWNGRSDISIGKRAIACLICSCVVSLILGLPVLGLVYLITN